MKSVVSTIFLIAAMVTTSSTFAGTDSEEYQKAVNKLQEALEGRDYKEAKVSLHDLLPLMKEDLKECKKTINEAKKAKEGAGTLKEMKKTLERKSEIYESLGHLLNVSPAAIRVRAKQVVTIVGEFETLTINHIVTL